MTSPRIARAHALVDEIRSVLTAADLTEVTVTIDAAEIPSGARHGVVVIAAPKLAFGGPFEIVVAEYDVHVIAGPTTDYLAAWDRIDLIIQALVDGHVNLKDGEPGSYGSLHGDPLPAYTLTLNDLD